LPDFSQWEGGEIQPKQVSQGGDSLPSVVQLFKLPKLLILVQAGKLSYPKWKKLVESYPPEAISLSI